MGKRFCDILQQVKSLCSSMLELAINAGASIVSVRLRWVYRCEKFINVCWNIKIPMARKALLRDHMASFTCHREILSAGTMYT